MQPLIVAFGAALGSDLAIALLAFVGFGSVLIAKKNATTNLLSEMKEGASLRRRSAQFVLLLAGVAVQPAFRRWLE